MIHVYTTDGKDHQRMPLSELADALRPLLAQPAPADVAAVPTPDWTTAPEWAQWWAVDESGFAYWYEDMPVCNSGTWRGQRYEWAWDYDHCPAWRKSLMQRPAAQPLEHDAAFWRGYVEEARRDADRLREQVAELEAIIERRERQNTTLMRAIDGMSDSRDRLAAQVTESVQAIERLTAERDEARRVATQHAEKLEALPWEALERLWRATPGDGAIAAVGNYLRANRPTEAKS